MCYLSTGTGSRVRHACFRTVSFCRGRQMVSLTLLWLLKVAFCYLSPLLLSHHRHSLFTQSGYLSSTMHTVSYTHTHIRTHTTHNHFTVHPDGAHTPSWASGLHEGEISLQINKCMKLMMKYLDDRSGGSLHVLAHLVQITWTLYQRELCEPCHTVGICLYFSYVYSSIGVGAFLFFYIVCI